MACGFEFPTEFPFEGLVMVNTTFTLMIPSRGEFGFWPLNVRSPEIVAFMTAPHTTTGEIP